MLARKKAPTPGKKKKGSAPRPPDRETLLRAGRLFRGLTRLYPDVHCELNYRNPFELLIATILSAQCTDVRVNKVTPALFAKYPTAAELAKGKPADVEDLIRSTGFFRTKTKSLLSAAGDIAGRHGNEVPATMESLTALRGVARKTANVVLGNAYHKNDGVVVDTHVARLTHRMGLTREKTPEKIERDLMALYPRNQWCLLSHLLIWHGRRVCDARRPDCAACTLLKDCPRNGVTTPR
jgi:endonuclease-3